MPQKENILAIFLHSMQQKWDQGTLGTQRLTLIGPRTRLGPSMDPAMALQYTQYGPLYIGYIFAFYATKKGSMDSGGTKVNPHWSFKGPCHGPTIQLIWPFWILRRQPGEAWVGLNSNKALNIKGHVRCIVGPWQAPLKDQEG